MRNARRITGVSTAVAIAGVLAMPQTARADQGPNLYCWTDPQGAHCEDVAPCNGAGYFPTMEVDCDAAYYIWWNSYWADDGYTHMYPVCDGGQVACDYVDDGY